MTAPETGHIEIETARLRLRPATSGDVTAMSSWLLPAALKPDWTLDDLGPHVADGRALALLDHDDAAIGLCVFRLDLPVLGSAAVPLLAVEPGRRFRGLGGEAGVAIDRKLRGLGFRSVYAPVPEDRGLPVYFWLRLGFRPVTRSQAPWPLAGLTEFAGPGIWMLRDAD